MEELFVRKFAKGDVVFREGDKQQFMYHVHEGKVGIYAHYGKKDEKLLAEICASDANPYFGEMALIDEAPRSATAVALEDCRLGEVPSHSLGYYFNAHPELVRDMLQRMSSRLRALTEDFTVACHTIAEQESNRKPDSEWLKDLKKYTAIFDGDPTPAELAALTSKRYYINEKHQAADFESTKTNGGVSVMEAKKYPAGTVIFNKGDLQLCMYEVMDGTVGIYADYGLPTQKKLADMTHEKNRFFGEMGLIDSLPRSATAVTEDDAVILTISAEQMNKFFMDDPEVLLAVMRQLSDRTRELTGDYMEAVKTIAHNQKYAASGEAKPNWLVDNLKKFTKLWHDLSSTVGSNK